MADHPSLPTSPRSRPLPLSALATRQIAQTQRPRRVLFGESFDPPPATPAASEPEIIAPSFTLEELELARAEAFAEGRAAGAAEAEASLVARQASALETCATAIAASVAEARRAAETTIAALARALIESLATMLPDHATAVLPVRIERLVADLQRSVGSEVALDLIASPQTASLLEKSLAVLRQSVASPLQLRLRPDNTLPTTEVRVCWASAEAVIDPAEVADAMRRLLGELLPAPPDDISSCGEHA